MTDEQDAIRESLRALTQFFVNDGTLGDTLLRVSEMACSITPAKFAGITMIVEGSTRTGVFTHPEAPEIDEAQYRTGQGPCISAFRHEQIYRIDSTSEDDRWPEFAKTALAHGIHSTLSVPLRARGDALGALNLYADSPSAFNDDHETNRPCLCRPGLDCSGQRPGLLGRPATEPESHRGNEDTGDDQSSRRHLDGPGRSLAR